MASWTTCYIYCTRRPHFSPEAIASDKMCVSDFCLTVHRRRIICLVDEHFNLRSFLCFAESVFSASSRRVSSLRHPHYSGALSALCTAPPPWTEHMNRTRSSKSFHAACVSSSYSNMEEKVSCSKGSAESEPSVRVPLWEPDSERGPTRGVLKLPGAGTCLLGTRKPELVSSLPGSHAEEPSCCTWTAVRMMMASMSRRKTMTSRTSLSHRPGQHSPVAQMRPTLTGRLDVPCLK